MEGDRIARRLTFVAIYQILGGLLGLYGALKGNSQFTPPQAAIPEVAFSFVLRGGSLALACLAVLSIISGALLLKRSRQGILLSGLTQLVQLPMIMAQGLHFHLFLLLSVGLGLAPNMDLLLNYFYGSGAILCLGNCQANFTGLNFIAGIILIVIAMAWKQERAFTGRAGATGAKGFSQLVAPAPGAASMPVRVGVSKRGLAFFVDLTMSTLAGLVVFALFGLAVPLDSDEGPFGMYLAISVFMIFMLGSPCLFSNSLGKFLMRIRIKGDGPNLKPSAWQCLVRGVLLPLWPVEALVILFSKSKRRIGDRLAGTEVIIDDRGRKPWHVRTVLVAATIVILFALAEGGLGLASRNTALYTSAVAFLEHNVLGQPTFDSPRNIGFLPAEVLMDKNNGHVVVPIMWPDGRKQYGALTLTRKEGQWRIQDWELRKQHQGFRYSFDY